MGLAQKARNDGQGEQKQQPRIVGDQGTGECDQRQRILGHRKQQAEKRNPTHGLSPGALEMIVELGILELGEIELRSVLHQLDAHRVGKEIAQFERSEEHTSELQSRFDLVCRLLLEKKNIVEDEGVQDLL